MTSRFFCREFLFDREDLGIEELTLEWFVHTKEHNKKRDSTSCGVIVLKVYWYI